MRFDQDQQLTLERIRLAGEQAELGDLLAGDPDARAGGQPAQAPVDPSELARIGERAALQ